MGWEVVSVKELLNQTKIRRLKTRMEFFKSEEGPGVFLERVIDDRTKSFEGQFWLQYYDQALFNF